MVRCEGLACGYPHRTVLEQIDLSVGAGEVLALLGPNGSGKSTLLKTLAKTLSPVAGKVFICGESLSEISYRGLARLVASVPQEEHPFFPFTVREVVLMGRLPHSRGLFDAAEDAAAADEAMREALCEDLGDRSILELSGGEKQRVLIARALAQGSQVLLLDEPSAHLDVSHQLALISLIQKLSRRGYAILAAVHDLNMASAMAQRALLLKDGRIGKDAAVSEVLENSMLEEVYGVRFERLRDSGGRVRVLPIEPSK